MTNVKLGIIGALVVAGVATPVVIQHQSQARLREEEGIVRQQTQQLAQLAAENERLSTLLAAKQADVGASTTQDPPRELLRLRGELGRLRLQEREIEQSRRDQMHAAQLKLANAEIELARISKAHSEKLVGDAELSQARFTVALLKAEAKGDISEAAQIRLRQAGEELARAAELRSQSLISQTEYEEAARKVESLRTEGR